MSKDKLENVPELFLRLVDQGCINENELRETDDGFYASVRSLADILACKGITTIPCDEGNDLECRLFFDDWYLYAVDAGKNVIYSLFKMREQEHDAELGLVADGDTPGVTISFIAFQTQILIDCLTDPSDINRKRINEEINRVVAYRGQSHDKGLKDYFIRPDTWGSYLVAWLYTEYIASLAQKGILEVPERYALAYQKNGLRGRVARIVEDINNTVDSKICDHRHIRICNTFCPTEAERLVILATYCGNPSFFSFAAEVQFHAKFLTWWAKIPIPVIGKTAYASAIRADMSIGDDEFVGPTPYYRSGSRLVKKQTMLHKERFFDAGCSAFKYKL